MGNFVGRCGRHDGAVKPGRVLTPAARAFLAGARRAILATVAPDGRPRLVPVCFALAPDDDARGRPILYTPLDEKPKRVGDPHHLALDALEMAIWSRRADDLAGLVHHSDRGVQYLAIRYTERMADAGAVTSVGSKGDSYDNALTETVNGLYKTELIRAQGPWRTIHQLELATAAWVAWWNEQRLHSACGDVPPAQFEAAYWERQVEATEAA